MIQGSDEWRAARLGKVTASRVADVTAKVKGGWGASRKNYMAELVAERLTGKATESYTNAAMQWGSETEPQARAAYEFLQNTSVEECGFIDHPRITMTGASPDGLLGDDGLLELKCPNTATHLDVLLTETIPDKYIVQMQWQMATTGRAWCDYCSFDPRLPDQIRLFTKRVERDEFRIEQLERDVISFLSELDEVIAALAARYGKVAA